MSDQVPKQVPYPLPEQAEMSFLQKAVDAAEKGDRFSDQGKMALAQLYYQVAKVWSDISRAESEQQIAEALYATVGYGGLEYSVGELLARIANHFNADDAKW